MGVPDFPRGAPEGRDDTMGNCVDPAEAARETAQIAGLLDRAEADAARWALSGYAGDGNPPGEGMVMTGADDVPGA